MIALVRTGSLFALLSVTQVLAFAQSDQQAPQLVTVTGNSNGLRSQSTTTSIVVGRDDLLRQGDGSLSDALKRQPGITVDAAPGKAPTLRMRGMGAGYVAILLNGLPAPADFSLESLSPDLVERVEIQRTSTAETSSQAIAGTVNVILRRPNFTASRSTKEFKIGSGATRLGTTPQFVAQLNDRSGSMAYGVIASYKRQLNPISALTTETNDHPALLRRIAWSDDHFEDIFEVAPRLSWQVSAADTITSQSYLRKRLMGFDKREDETTDIGVRTAFPHAVHALRARPIYGYADIAWTRKLANGARLALKVSGFYTTRDADFVFRGMGISGNLLEQHHVSSGPTEKESTFNGNWRHPLGGNHALVAGWEIGRKQRSEFRRERQTDAAGRLLLLSDEHYRAQVSRAAYFVQDEWDIDTSWSAYAGVRREDLHTIGEGNADAPVNVTAGAWSPVFQALFKPLRTNGETDPRDQFRFAASRSYKAPSIFQLMPRRYTVDNNNSATNPDQQGNPRLRPELTFGLDLAWERYIGKDFMLSMSAYHKRISDITLLRVAAIGGVWTAVPENRGGATVRGIEFEVRASRGPLATRVNLVRSWSRLDDLPGPHNHLDGQPAYSGNFGLDYASAFELADIGCTYSYTGAMMARSDRLTLRENGNRRQLDVYALWKRDATSRLRVSVSDLLHQDYLETVAYQDASPRSRTTVYSNRTTWRVTWEQAF